MVHLVDQRGLEILRSSQLPQVARTNSGPLLYARALRHAPVQSSEPPCWSERDLLSPSSESLIRRHPSDLYRARGCTSRCRAALVALARGGGFPFRCRGASRLHLFLLEDHAWVPASLPHLLILRRRPPPPGSARRTYPSPLGSLPREEGIPEGIPWIRHHPHHDFQSLAPLPSGPTTPANSFHPAAPYETSVHVDTALVGSSSSSSPSFHPNTPLRHLLPPSWLSPRGRRTV